MIIKFFRVIAFFLFIKLSALNISVASTSATDSEENDVSKFKLGFEFQETSHLCPWNTKFNDFQNKPLFTVKYKERPLWCLVIDTHDLEFVTYPFDPKDRELLEYCTESISDSLNILNVILRQKNSELLEAEKVLCIQEKDFSKEKKYLVKSILALEKEVSIEKEILNFIDKQKEVTIILIESGIDHDEYNEFNLRIIKQELNKKRKEIFEKEESLNTIRRGLDDTQQFIIDTQKKLEDIRKSTGKTTFDEWKIALENQLNRNRFYLEFGEEFIGLQGREIVLPRKYQGEDFWEPTFSPQTTVQHPLEMAIPLYFSLFILGSNTAYSQKYFKDFIKALPKLNVYIDNLDAIETDVETIYTPLNGLIFLHGVTLSGMAHSITESEANALELMVQNYKKYKQIDVKMNLFLMSRLSFSHMFRLIEDHEKMPFAQHYQNSLIQGNKLFVDSRIQENFHKVNYGQQFFDEENRPRDLSLFATFINKDFAAANKKNIGKLLRKGIISTAMIRNLCDDIYFEPAEETVYSSSSTVDSATNNSIKISEILNGYFMQTIETVEQPNKKRYDIEVNVNDGDLSRNTNEVSMVSRMTMSLKHKTTDHDALSQPWLLDAEDSMARYSRNHDQSSSLMGEAIIEMRRIEDISPAFLQGYTDGTEDFAKVFLKNPENIQKQACALFDAIIGFQLKLNDRDYQVKIFKDIMAYGNV